jgi:hypothetical protein
LRLLSRDEAPGAEKVNEGSMESAAELHEARVLRARIEMREAEMAAPPGDVPPADRARLAEEIARLKGDYRRVLARQADEDYCRRRAEWRAEQTAARARERDRNSACA